MGFVRGLDSGAIPLARPSDIVASAFGGEYEIMGHVKDLVFGADLSSIESIWSKILVSDEKKDTKRDAAREWHDDLARLGKHLKP